MRGREGGRGGKWWGQREGGMDVESEKEIGEVVAIWCIAQSTVTSSPLLSSLCPE